MDEIEESRCENAVFACKQHNIKAQKTYILKTLFVLEYETWNL